MNKHRYLPMTEQDRKEMLEVIGVDSVERLFDDIPESIRCKETLPISGALDEPALLKHMRGIAERNADFDRYASFLGAGIYDHHIPVVIQHVISRSEFYTAYTPYQPEISQGELQAIFEFQSYICELTGMAVANAGMYDGPTALAEAAALASGYTKRKRIVVSRAVHPEAREILRTSARGLGLEIVEAGFLNGITDMDALGAAIDEETAAVILQSPNFFGCIEDVRAAEPLIHAKKGLLVVSANPLSLGLLEAPGALGADVVVGDVQPLGIPAALGGPTCGYFAVTEPLMRRIPGRIVGQTKDLDGKRGFVLTLQAREQHIRREKATSNICSNQALLALCASVYLSVMGKTGIREAALLNLRKAHYAADLVAASSTAASSTAAAGTAASSTAASSTAASSTAASSTAASGTAGSSTAASGTAASSTAASSTAASGTAGSSTAASGTAASSTAASSTAASGTAGSVTSGSRLSLPFPAPFFNEFAVKLPDGTNLKALNETLLRKGFIGGCDLGAAYPELKGHMLIAVTERRTKDEIDRFVRELEVAAV